MDLSARLAALYGTIGQTLSGPAGGGKPNQLRVHLRAAIGNGVTKEEIREVLLHSLICCGVPAGVDSCTHAADVLKDMGLE